MLRLMTEKTRLERELVMWQANAERVQRRLAGIERQVRQLDDIADPNRAKRRLADVESQVRQLDDVADPNRAKSAEAEAESPAFAEMTLTY